MNQIVNHSVKFLMVVVLTTGCRRETFFAPRTVSCERAVFITEWHQKYALWQDSSYHLSSKETAELAWSSMAFAQKNDTVRKIFEKVLRQYNSLDDDNRYNLLQAYRALFGDLPQEFLSVQLQKSTNPKINVLLALMLSEQSDQPVVDFLMENSAYTEAIYVPRDGVSLLSVDWKKVLQHKPFSGCKNIWVFLPENREIPGKALLQDGNGHWVVQDGKLQNFEYLGLSAANAPFYLTNGNTPCGVYSIQQMKVSENKFIGPVPLIETVLPFEAKPQKFFKKTIKDSVWSIDLYRQLIPEGLESFASMNQAFRAGQLGRGEIVVHGTTINPEFFKGTANYPLTPSLGCLCGKELWDGTTGKLLESEHFKLLQAFRKLDAPEGYLIVVPVNSVSVEQLSLELDKIFASESN